MGAKAAIRLFCQILFVQGALQCFQARLEFPDRGFSDIDSIYHEMNDEVEIKSSDLSKGSFNNEGKDIKNEYLENDKMVSDQENRFKNPNIGSQQRRANAEKRREATRERFRIKHQNRLHHRTKDSDLEGQPEEEITDHDGETASFYLTKSSDISNWTSKLGPGPIPIQIMDPTTKKPTTTRTYTSVSSNSTRLSVDDAKNGANVTFENDDDVPLLGGHKKTNRKRLKLQTRVRKLNDALMKLSDEYIPVKQRKKEGRMFHKQNSLIHQNERGHSGIHDGHKKRKHNKIHDEAVNIRKDTEKYNLNDEEQYTNLSVINKSYQNAVSKKFDLKNQEDSSIVNVFDKKVPCKNMRLVVDKVNNDDAKKLRFITAERDRIEGELASENVSLRDETAEVEKKNTNINSRSNTRKGIWSKIEHGSWIDQVTLFPLPDFSVKRNRTANKNKLTSVEDNDEISKPVANKKKHNRNKSVKMNIDEGSPLSKTLKKLLNTPELAKVKGEINNNELGNKRNERDARIGKAKNNFRLPRERSVFNRHDEISDGKSDEMYDDDLGHDNNIHSRVKSNYDNRRNRPEISEKEEDYYEYESRLRGDEKPFHEVGIANRTIPTTEKTFVPKTECGTIMPTKSTRKPPNSKSTFKSNVKPGLDENIGNGIDKKNKTDDPYEMFLTGQLADNFVNEVLKKVKVSRKISRELGYSNETDETCDRCIELKPIRIPELGVMRNSLGKCSRNSAPPVQNCSMCCGVPRPMAKYLDVLVYFEKENGNNFYNKIQDDSSFIFTGDYPEFLSKEEKMKIKDKYVDDRSTFDKDTFDRQRLREDLTEEKNEDKSADTYVTNKAKNGGRDRDGDDSVSENDTGGKNKETQGGIKRYLRKFGKSISDTSNQRTSEEFYQDKKENNIFNEVDHHDSAPLEKEYTPKKLLESYRYPLREFGKIRKNFVDTKKQSDQGQLNTRQESEKNPIGNFDRIYGKSNYNYFKQYPQKSSQKETQMKYTFNDDNLRGTETGFLSHLLKDNPDNKGFYKLPFSNKIKNKADDQLNFKDNYVDYPPKRYTEDKRTNLNENYKSYQPKYDLLYEDNGEYSLYPNLDGPHASEEDVDYKDNRGDNARMVKRDADTLPGYDDEPNVFFEMPDMEYDLY